MFRYLTIARILMNTQPDDGGAGGGGAGGGGGGSSGFTADQERSIRSIVGSVVNQTIAAHNKQSDKKREADLKAATDNFAKLLDERFANLPSGGEGGGGGKGGEGEGGGKGGKPKDRELETLKQTVATLSTDLKSEREQRIALRNRQRANDLREAVALELQKAGIAGVPFRSAYALLTGDNRVRYAADDSEDMVFIDEAGGELDLPVGLSTWVKSDEAKFFLPGTGANGSGSTRTRTAAGPKPGEKPTRDQQMNVLGNAIRDALTGGE